MSGQCAARRAARRSASAHRAHATPGGAPARSFPPAHRPFPPPLQTAQDPRRVCRRPCPWRRQCARVHRRPLWRCALYMRSRGAGRSTHPMHARTRARARMRPRYLGRGPCRPSQLTCAPMHGRMRPHACTPPPDTSHDALEPNPKFVEELKGKLPDAGAEIVLVRCARARTRATAHAPRLRSPLCCMRGCRRRPAARAS